MNMITYSIEYKRGNIPYGCKHPKWMPGGERASVKDALEYFIANTNAAESRRFAGISGAGPLLATRLVKITTTRETVVK